MPHRHKDVGRLTKIDATQIREVLQKLMPQRQKDVGSLTKRLMPNTQRCGKSHQFFIIIFFFIWVLRHVKIISLILSRVNRKVGARMGDPCEKTSDHPQAELGLSQI